MLLRTCSRGRATPPSRQPCRSSLSRPPEVSVPGRILDLMWGEEVLSHVQLSHVPRGRVGSSISFRSRIAVQGAGRLDRRQMVLDLDALFSVFHAGPRGLELWTPAGYERLCGAHVGYDGVRITKADRSFCARSSLLPLAVPQEPACVDVLTSCARSNVRGGVAKPFKNVVD